MRLIGVEGEQLGILGTPEAMNLAEEVGLDLVELSPNAEPPVCRLMDFGKFQFQQNKKRQAARKKQQQVQVKEIKFRPVTDVGDYQVKTKRIIKFLEAGARVQVTVRFRGREVMHAHLAEELLTRVLDDVAAHGVVEMPPKLEGRQMMMVLKSK